MADFRIHGRIDAAAHDTYVAKVWVFMTKVRID